MSQEPSPDPTPILDKIPGPMEARFLSSVGLGFGTRIGRTQLCPTPALDKKLISQCWPDPTHRSQNSVLNVGETAP